MADIHRPAAAGTSLSFGNHQNPFNIRTQHSLIFTVHGFCMFPQKLHKIFTKQFNLPPGRRKLPAKILIKRNSV